MAVPPLSGGLGMAVPDGVRGSGAASPPSPTARWSWSHLPGDAGGTWPATVAKAAPV